MRTIGSTIIGESVDSTIFMTIAFYGILPTEALPGMILAQATFKTLYETIATPFTYLVIDYFKRLEGVEQTTRLPSKQKWVVEKD